MLNEDQISRMRRQGRYVALAQTGDEDLGPLKLPFANGREPARLPPAAATSSTSTCGST